MGAGLLAGGRVGARVEGLAVDFEDVPGEVEQFPFGVASVEAATEEPVATTMSFGVGEGPLDHP